MLWLLKPPLLTTDCDATVPACTTEPMSFCCPSCCSYHTLLSQVPPNPTRGANHIKSSAQDSVVAATAAAATTT